MVAVRGHFKSSESDYDICSVLKSDCFAEEAVGHGEDSKASQQPSTDIR